MWSGGGNCGEHERIGLHIFLAQLFDQRVNIHLEKWFSDQDVYRTCPRRLVNDEESQSAHVAFYISST